MLLSIQPRLEILVLTFCMILLTPRDMYGLQRSITKAEKSFYCNLLTNFDQNMLESRVAFFFLYMITNDPL